MAGDINPYRDADNVSVATMFGDAITSPLIPLPTNHGDYLTMLLMNPDGIELCITELAKNAHNRNSGEATESFVEETSQRLNALAYEYYKRIIGVAVTRYGSEIIPVMDGEQNG
jgi:hypothetical protein